MKVKMQQKIQNINQSTDSKNVKSENAVEEDAAAAGISEDGEENLNGISEEELAAELYKGNVVKYLLFQKELKSQSVLTRI